VTGVALPVLCGLLVLGDRPAGGRPDCWAPRPPRSCWPSI